MCRAFRFKPIGLAVILAIMMTFFAGRAFCGLVEIRIHQSTLQSFVDAALPVSVKQEVHLLGAVKIPITLKLFNPGPVVLARPEAGKASFLKLAMDYDLTSGSPLIAPARGRLGGDVTVALSQDQEYLLLSFGEITLALTPYLQVSLSSFFKPIKIPLFKAFPVKVQDKEIFGRFRDVQIDVQEGQLIIRCDMRFENNVQMKI